MQLFPRKVVVAVLVATPLVQILKYYFCMLWHVSGSNIALEDYIDIWQRIGEIQ